MSVIDIGIPRGAPGDADAGLITPAVLRDMPRRGAGSTKFTSGNVVVIGGSRGLTGAPDHGGAGRDARRRGLRDRRGAPARWSSSFAARLLEAMFVRRCPRTDGALSPEALAGRARTRSRRADAVVLGPGLGRSAGAQALVRELVQRIDVPLVIDADGLNALAGRLEEPAPPPLADGPHARTPASSAGCSRSTRPRSSRARLHHARAAAGAREGARRAQGRRHARRGAVRPRRDLARAARPRSRPPGTGDVLSGVTGAMLAKGLSPAHAACAAVYAHVRAGQLAARAARAGRRDRVGRDRRAARRARRVGFPRRCR